MAIGDQYGWNFSSMEAETAGSALSDLIPEDVYNYSTVGVKPAILQTISKVSRRPATTA